ncbi:hypothetical protein [Streptomyces sp. x-19]|uniref:hypothetical protein n=1 Tax=Streptomyces sp. x-19 TaxID=2789280 RepID=UPI00398124ED
MFDVVVDDPAVGGGAFAPVQDLLAGQVLAEQLLVVLDVVELHLLRSRGGAVTGRRTQTGREPGRRAAARIAEAGRAGRAGWCDVAATSRSSVPAGNAYDRSSTRSAPRAIDIDV